MKISNILACLQAVAPLRYQESWDNSGLQTGNPDAPCTGVMVCLDATAEVIAAAVASGCNMVLSHHPRIFRGVKSVLADRDEAQRTIVEAIRHDVALYCCHTPIDSAPRVGISAKMAQMLQLRDAKILVPQTDRETGQEYGLGIIGDFEAALTPRQLASRIKEAFKAPVVRTNSDPQRCDVPSIRRLALCSGSASEFIHEAIAQGADAYLTSDTRYHDFADHADPRTLSCIDIFDIGHYESECIVCDIFKDIITTGCPEAKVEIFASRNPVTYY